MKKTTQVKVPARYKAAQNMLASYIAANDGKLQDGSPRTLQSFAAMRFIEPTWEHLDLWRKSAVEYAREQGMI